MKKKKMYEMSFTVNAKSLTSTGIKPYIRTTSGAKELLDIISSKEINSSREVLGFISLNTETYQSKEELCYIMTTTSNENFTSSLK